jgi:type IV pilus assembly protein PilM
LGEPNPATETVSGLLIAAPRAPIISAVQAVERAGLRVARVDLSSFAVLRSIAAENLAVEAVIDIGAHLTTIVIHNQGVPKVVRSVPRAGQELTDMLVSKGGLDAVAAEQAKREVGVTGTDRVVGDVVTQGLRPLFAEIRSTLQYFASLTSGVRVERVSLTGRGAELPGLAQTLGDQLGVPTNLVPPMQHIRNRWRSGPSESEVPVPATAVSVGLAMGAAA